MEDMRRESIKIKFAYGFVLLAIFFSGLRTAVLADEIKSVVRENPYNRLAAQLENKDTELSKREQALQALETRLEKSYNLVFGLVGFLFLLIVANFLLDHKRRKNSLLNKPL